MDPRAQTYLAPVYIAYGVLSVALTIWSARTLFRNGAVFLEEVFDQPRMADAVNRLSFEKLIGQQTTNSGTAFVRDLNTGAVESVNDIWNRLMVENPTEAGKENRLPEDVLEEIVGIEVQIRHRLRSATQRFAIAPASSSSERSRASSVGAG